MFCSVVSFVIVPARIVIIVSRKRGLIIMFVSLCMLWLVRGWPVNVRRIIRVLYEADSAVAINVIIRAQELIWEFIMVSMMVSFE